MKIPTQYQPLCDQMSDAGWLSHVVAGCNANHRHGDGKKHFFARRLLATRTGQSFSQREKVPSFNRANAIPGSLRFHDEGGWRTPSVLIHRAANLAAVVEYGRLLVAYLSDIPADRITTASPAAAPESPLSAAEGKRLLRLHYHRERKSSLVKAKRRKILAQMGRLACAACDDNHEQTYGPAAARVFEVHHLSPLGDLEKIEATTTLDQLALVCANCHRVLHRTRPPLLIGALRTLLGR